MRQVTIDGTNYDIYCDMAVLEKLQDENGSINAWEKAIIGWKGSKKVEKDGKEQEVALFGESSYRVVCRTAVHMINEAVEIFNEEHPEAKKEKVALKKLQRARWTGKMVEQIADILHEEFVECFVSKNAETEQSHTEKEEMQTA